ncbi:MAG: protein kinase [Bryobacteraceae bacterium]|jgi:serine/threonine protein kinase
MSLAPGTRLGPYEILGPLGAGGMGEVYRAKDTKLDREVAIKVLPSALAQHPDRLARFEREAKVLAALNHPNIAIIYGLEDHAIVMELVEGPTLADRIAVGALPLDESLKIAVQIADALEAAHEKGIVHRDLKPANIKVREDGTVKVLDFGLATAVQSNTAERSDGANSPTLTMGGTEVGVILGTASYMSPEQAAGKPVDRRADIWSFGVVLWEMLTGRRLFHGESVSHTLADVLRAEIDFGKLPASTPAPIRELLKRCLDRDLKTRLRDIGEARIAIQKYLANPTSSPDVTSATSPSRHLWLWIAATSVCFLAAVALAFIHFRERQPEAPVVRSTLLPPDSATPDFGNGLGLPTLSPDGLKIVFGARTADGKDPLWVRSLDGLVAQPLAGTDGAIFPFWSPDGKFIAFFADSKLKKIDASGGPAITLADAPLGRGGSWSPEGVIIFAPVNALGPLLRVSSAGGASTPISTAQGRLPWFLPDGRHFLYQVQPGNSTIRAGSLDGGESKMVIEAGSNALYAEGHLLFLRDGALMAQTFDAKRLVTTGEAVPVAEHIQTVLNSGTVGVFSVSQTGMLAYRSGLGFSGLELTWYDRAGKKGAEVGEPAGLVDFRLSPDRKSLAATITTGGYANIWTYDVSRGLRTRLTFEAANDQDPVWSPDGRNIILGSVRKGHRDLYRKQANGAGPEELLYSDDLEKYPRSWSPDGNFLLYDAAGPKTGGIWALPLTQQPGGSLKPFPVVQPPFSATLGEFSPDGRWIAYQSNESQRYEIYVTSFPPGSGGRRQISTAGGVLARWRPDGKEIFYIAPDRRLMAAEVVVKGGTLEPGTVRPLFGSPDLTPGNPYYDVSGDGQQFLLRTFPEQKSAEPLTLVQNWVARLKK